MRNFILLAFTGGTLLVQCTGGGAPTQAKALAGPSAFQTLKSDTLPPRDSLMQSEDVHEEAYEESSKSLEAINRPKSAAPITRKYDEKATNQLMGKFDPAKHPDFVPVPRPYTDRDGMILHKETLAAFMKMHQAARRDGITLTIISSTRSFYRQKEIWEGKWARYAADTPDPEARARRILEYSSMPGSSRHHWGTDIDLNDLENHSFEAGGPHEKVYIWLTNNAHRFGFGQPYTPKGPDRPEGYNEEKWHWSYLPLAKPLLEQFKISVSDSDIKGFEGAETARQIGIVRNYVLGISPTCK